MLRAARCILSDGVSIYNNILITFEEFIKSSKSAVEIHTYFKIDKIS